MIHGSCSDYRAAATVDLALDQADINRKIGCPTLVFFGAAGQMAHLFDIPGEWRKRCEHVAEASLPGGHFFVDQFPDETAAVLMDFIGTVAV
jgi:haloacetate dehalogenase